ncbi:hypothetical protein ABZP36_010283 [Zizania latifolia]
MLYLCSRYMLLYIYLAPSVLFCLLLLLFLDFVLAESKSVCSVSSLSIFQFFLHLHFALLSFSFLFADSLHIVLYWLICYFGDIAYVLFLASQFFAGWQASGYFAYFAFSFSTCLFAVRFLLDRYGLSLMSFMCYFTYLLYVYCNTLLVFSSPLVFVCCLPVMYLSPLHVHCTSVNMCASLLMYFRSMYTCLAPCSVSFLVFSSSYVRVF